MKKSVLCSSFVLGVIGSGSAFARIPAHRMSFADSSELLVSLWREKRAVVARTPALARL